MFKILFPLPFVPVDKSKRHWRVSLKNLCPVPAGPHPGSVVLPCFLSNLFPGADGTQAAARSSLPAGGQRPKLHKACFSADRPLPATRSCADSSHVCARLSAQQGSWARHRPRVQTAGSQPARRLAGPPARAREQNRQNCPVPNAKGTCTPRTETAAQAPGRRLPHRCGQPLQMARHAKKAGQHDDVRCPAFLRQEAGGVRLAHRHERPRPLQRLAHGLQGLCEIVFRMRKRNHGRFKRRRGQKHAVGAHFAEEHRVRFGITALHVFKI